MEIDYLQKNHKKVYTHLWDFFFYCQMASHEGMSSGRNGLEAYLFAYCFPVAVFTGSLIKTQKWSTGKEPAAATGELASLCALLGHLCFLLPITVYEDPSCT